AEDSEMKGLIATVALAVFAVVGLGADKPLAWPQFRGPGGSGVADGQKPPVEVGPEKNVKWKVSVPSGLSSPVVAGDKLVLTAFDGGKLYTIAYRRADGREAWRGGGPGPPREPPHTTREGPARHRPRPRRTAGGSSRTSARAACSATTWTVRNSGGSRCRRRPSAATSAAAPRRSSPTASSSSSATRPRTRGSSPSTGRPGRSSGRRSGC